MFTFSDPASPTSTKVSRLVLEDRLGKVILLAFYGWSLVTSLDAIWKTFDTPSLSFAWWATTVVRLSSLAFIGLILWLTLRRKPALDVAPGIEARVSAFLGTFILMVIPQLPRADIGPTQVLMSLFLILVGMALSVWCLWWLGRSFSIVATARELVTSGPYGRVRHPLYVAEAVSVIGIVLMNGTLAGLAVGALQFFFQYRRMLHEEAVLARAFPDYADYSRRVPRVIPRLLNRRG